MSWLPKKKILVPIDFSEKSYAAVDEALKMVDDPSHIDVLHVLPELAPAEPGVIWSTIDDEHRRRNVRETIEERFSDERYQGLHIHVAIGDPGHQVADHAKGAQAELIVLPSRGRTGLAHLLVGSTAERVVRLAHCPVLVLRD